jgi:hypothetical protein
MNFSIYEADLNLYGSNGELTAQEASIRVSITQDKEENRFVKFNLTAGKLQPFENFVMSFIKLRSALDIEDIVKYCHTSVTADKLVETIGEKEHPQVMTPVPVVKSSTIAGKQESTIKSPDKVKEQI